MRQKHLAFFNRCGFKQVIWKYSRCNIFWNVAIYQEDVYVHMCEKWSPRSTYHCIWIAPSHATTLFCSARFAKSIGIHFSPLFFARRRTPAVWQRAPLMELQGTDEWLQWPLMLGNIRSIVWKWGKDTSIWLAEKQRAFVVNCQNKVFCMSERLCSYSRSRQ